MGVRYYVGGCVRAEWDTTEPDDSNWSEESGGPRGASVPAEDDDVILDENSGTGEVRVSRPFAIRSLDCTRYAGTLVQSANVRIRYTERLQLSEAMTYVADDFAAVLEPASAVAEVELAGKVANVYDVELAREVFRKALAESDGKYDDDRVRHFFAALDVSPCPVFKTAEGVEAWLNGKGEPDAWVNPLEAGDAAPYEERARRVALGALETWNGKDDFRDVLDVALLKAGLDRAPLFKSADDVIAWAKGAPDVHPIGWVELDPKVAKVAAEASAADVEAGAAVAVDPKA